MEYHQAIQNRAGQTSAVVTQYLLGLQVGQVTATNLQSLSAALEGLAQTRDDALTAYDGANNGENLAFLALRALVLALPLCAEGELDDTDKQESGLLDLLASVYAIVPRTTELALERGHKLKSALTKINAFLAAQMPVRDPITSGAKGVAELVALMAAQPALEQAVTDAAADVTGARTVLRVAATALDRLNKRFYKKLDAESRTNEALAAALGQIATDSAHLPGTLGIKSILQGGTDGLHLLVSYDNGSFDGSLQSVIQWQVVGVDTDFTHAAPADPSGNALGPFTVGQVVKIRTRVTNSNGTTTGSTRTITVKPL